MVLADGSERTYHWVEPSPTPASTSALISTAASGATTRASGGGDLHVDGEHVTDCDARGGRRLKQHRDCIVRVTDLADGSTGVGTMQSNVVGAHPRDGSHRGRLPFA